MPKLIALVATAVMVNGVRTIVEAGAELPELNAHDEREQLQSGSAQNPEDLAAQARADEALQAQAAEDIAAARVRVQQQTASTAPASGAEAGAAAGADDTDSAATAGKGKAAKK